MIMRVYSNWPYPNATKKKLTAQTKLFDNSSVSTVGVGVDAYWIPFINMWASQILKKKKKKKKSCELCSLPLGLQCYQNAFFLLQIFPHTLHIYYIIFRLTLQYIPFIWACDHKIILKVNNHFKILYLYLFLILISS